MEWVAVLCLLSAFSVLVEGQGEFRQPPSDNYNLPLDPYQAASSFVMLCSYVDGMTTFNYAWTKDGANIQPSIGSVLSVGDAVLATVAVPNGEYLSSLEDTYTCRVSLGGATRGSRNVIVALPVLFSVNETTVVVRAGEAVRVNCSQTGYIRTQWRWRRNGVDLPTAPSERVYTELSGRSKVGTATATTVPNHQSLFLHLWHARVMDNGEYTCITETGTQTVTVDVQPPDNVRFSDNGPVSYEMPRPWENTSVSYADFLYNGSEGSGGMLTGGVGQLVDGVKGTATLGTDGGRFPWVGWDTPPQQVIFEFGSLQQFGSVTVHAYLNSPGVTWFGTVEVSISQNKEQWSTFSFGTDGLRGPRDITIPTQMESGNVVEGRYVRLIFSDTQGSGPMLISEVSFNSTVVPVTSPPLPAPTNTISLIAGLVAGGVVILVLLLVIVLLAVVLAHQRRAGSRGLYDFVRQPITQNGHTLPPLPSEPQLPPGRYPKEHLMKLDQMESNPIYQLPGGEGAEYAVINNDRARVTSITSRDVSPPVPPPPYRARASTSPKTDTIPEEVDLESNIYARPGSIGCALDNFEDIYSEPYDLSAFSTHASEPVVSPDASLTPYSSVYAMPAPLERWEGRKEVTARNVSEVKELGVGQFGEVVLAQTVGLSLKDLGLSDTNTDTSISIPVAIKKLKDTSQKATLEAFEKEIKFMSRLSHKNVIQLLAICLKGTPFIVMEYMEEGDLNQFLKKHQFSSATSDYSNALDMRDLMNISNQIASGMEYLASKKFIHRDLATRNCLVGKNLVVKIADFGMSQNLYSAYYFRLKGRAVLPIRWMAFECFYGRFSVKSDVFAFGVTLWEVLTLCKEQPYEGWADQDVIQNAIKPSRGGETEKLPKPELCSSELYHLMLSCWRHDPDSRPSFSSICKTLQDYSSANGWQ